MMMTESNPQYPGPRNWTEHELTSETPESAKRRFFTSARPGRREAGSRGRVSDETADAWARWVVQRLERPTVLSLLGIKAANGASEFAYYSFYGGSDEPDDDAPSFGEWLRSYGIALYERPTADGEPVPQAAAESIAELAIDIVRSGGDLLIVDSGGADRTGQIAGLVQRLWANGATEQWAESAGPEKFRGQHRP